MRPWNPHAQTFHGESIVGQIPVRVVVHGPPMTGPQTAMLQAAYASFQAGARLSVVRNPSAQGILPDGSRYTIDCVNGACSCVVWTVEDSASDGDSGVLLFESSSTTGQTMLVPAGGYAAPNGRWKVVRDVDRKYAGPSDAGGRPGWTAQSWHSPVSKEYYVREDVQSLVERAGARVLFDVPSDGDIQGAPFTTSVDGTKKLAVALRDQDRAWVIYGDAVNTAPNAPGLPKPMTGLREQTVITVERPEYLWGFVVHPSGRKALVTVEVRDPALTTPAPGEERAYNLSEEWWVYPHSHLPNTRVAARDTRSTETINHRVEEYTLLPGGEWAHLATPFEGEAGGATTKSVFTGSVFSPVRLTGPFAITLPQRPTEQYHGISGLPCSYPSNTRALFSSARGPTRFVESQVFDSGDVLRGDEVARHGGGVWYLLNGAPVVASVRTTLEHTGEVTSTVDAEVWDSYYCAIPEHEWRSGGTWKATHIESGSIDRRVKKRQHVSLPSGSFETLAVDVHEVAQFSYDMRTTRDGVTTTTGAHSVSTVLDVSVLERRVLVADPQFELLCYIEAAYEYSRTASASVTTANDGTGVVASHSGGDLAPPPARPVGRLIVSFAGEVVVDETIDPPPITPPGTEADYCPVCDCILNWIDIVRDGGVFTPTSTGAVIFASEMGIYAREAPTLHPRGGMEKPLASWLIGTLAVDHAIGLSGAGLIYARYAKDPRTGAGVLHVLSGAPATQPFVKTFVVDLTGVRPLEIIDEDIDQATITKVVPT